MSEPRKVLISEDLFIALGASRVEWGEPDADGFYTPTLYRERPFTIEDNEKPELVSTISGPISELEDYEFANCRAKVHPAKNCEGTYCPLHRPSKHSMLEWDMVLRETGLIERRCQHGVGHPDPDSARFMDSRFNPGESAWGIHGCDRCCS